MNVLILKLNLVKWQANVTATTTQMVAKCLLMFTITSLLMPSPARSQNTSPAKGLKDYYQNLFPVGVAVSVKNLKDQQNRQFIAGQFNSITAENCMKMGPIHPEKNRYNWKDADDLVNFAVKNGLRVRGHNLCWHQQTPKWFFYDDKGGLVSKDTLLRRLKDHIFAVVGRYKGKVYAWDVVNEAIADNNSEYLRNSLWYKICGEDFIAKAFEYAHEADPEAILVYNDYNTERAGKRDRIIRLLKSLQDKKVPVHAVGLQAHWSLWEPSETELETAINDYSALGLKIQITELDVSVYPWEKNHRQKGPTDTLAYNNIIAGQQSAKYRSIFNILRKHAGTITSVTFWNLNDGYTWLNDYPVKGRKNYPLLFDKDFQPKPPYHEVITF